MRWEYIRLVASSFAFVACHDNAAATADVAVLAPAASTASAAVPACDADAAWFADFPPGAVDDAFVAAHPARFTKKLAAWTPECRHQALLNLCSRGCDFGDNDVSDLLINASATPTEKQDATKFRLERNAARATKWRDLYNRTKALADHALAIQSSPRSSAYLPANPSAEQLAEKLVNGDPCITRMKADDAKIDQVRAELEKEDTRLWLQAVAFAPLDGLLVSAHSCGDCSNDRSSCSSLRSDLKEAADSLTAFEKQVATERAATAK